MTISIKNKRIAQFMGYKANDNGYYDMAEFGYTYEAEDTIKPCKCTKFKPSEMLFNKDWKWLMSVVEAIDSITNEFVIRDCSATIYVDDNTTIERNESSSRMQAVYDVIIDYLTHENIYADEMRIIKKYFDTHYVGKFETFWDSYSMSEDEFAIVDIMKCIGCGVEYMVVKDSCGIKYDIVSYSSDELKKEIILESGNVFCEITNFIEFIKKCDKYENEAGEIENNLQQLTKSTEKREMYAILAKEQEK